jgi:hypothetical protein
LAVARKPTVDQLATIERQMRDLAETQAIDLIGGKSRSHGRHSTSWRPTHERAFRAIMAQLRDKRASEIRALERKRDRQTAAIEGFALRHGLNIDAASLIGINLAWAGH